MAILKKSTDSRPVFLNLLQIQLPVTALVSIMHRISGVIMIILLPVLLVAFLGVTVDPGFLVVFQMLPSPVVKLCTATIVLTYMVHILAGLRHLWHAFSGSHTLQSTRYSAYFVLGLILFWLMLVGYKLWY